MRQFRFMLLGSVALVPAAAYADDATTIPQVVITATRDFTPLSQIASSMTVITDEDIQRENKRNVEDVLREVPSLTVANNGGLGQTSRVFMRGSNSNHVLVLIDGVRANDPSDPGNAFDFANLTTDNIERIEVMRGPQSTLYGSEAIGGVINIITKKGEGKPKYTGFAEYGRYNSMKEGVGTSGEMGRTSYSFSASHGSSDGISTFDKKFGAREKDSTKSTTVSANVESRLTENFSALINARYNRNYAEFDSPGAFTRPSDDPLPHNDSQQFNGRVAGKLSLYDGQWTQELGVSTLNLNRDLITVYYDSVGNELFGRQEQQGWRQNLDWVHHIKVTQENTLSLGGEIYSDHFKAIGVREVNVDDKALFADDQFTIGKRFFMNVGARNDYNQAFGRQFTWKAAPGYHILETGTTLKATYGKGFKAPSLSQLYDLSYGNALLKPEKSKGWDFGFEQMAFGEKVTFGSTFFRNDITNLIGNDPSPPYASINTGKARLQGVESVFSYKPFTHWTFSANHTYTLAQDRAKDKELLRRPRHMFNAGATYQYSQAWDMGADVRFSSNRNDIDINSPYGLVYVKSFTTLDLNTNYKLTSYVTLYGRLDNLLDKRYEEVYAYGQRGRSLYVGMKTAF